MFMSRMRTAWVGAGLLLTLTAGSPVWADDVELLLSTPASVNAAKPNILFIIDSSGSMREEEEITQEPYDPGKTYTGDCESDKYYWNEGDDAPECDGNQKFYKTSFVCQQGVIQAAASGSFTDTMAQYRPNKKGKWKWRKIASGELNRWVECEEDSSVHGFWTNPTGEPFARIGTNVTPWTSDPDSEVNWGVKPTHKIITVYDPNYLNWLNNAGSVLMRRTDIVKAVTKNVLGSINDVNVGFMRFHEEQGGPVIFGIKDLDANRAAINTLIDNIPADGWTPLSETMYEAALYYRGLQGDYGDFNDTDTAALSSYGDADDPYYYKQPAEYACSKNYVVLLTDGEPTRDVDVYDKAPLLPGYSSAVGRSTCTGDNDHGACLDDIAEYLSKVDINTGVAGNQHVTTHTIGFTVDLPILKATAENSGGEYYLASDVASLTKALTDIVSNIFDRDISFTAPAVAVNAFNRTQHLNDMYVSVFRATDHVHWPGNMKKYTIRDSTIKDSKLENAVDPDTGFFAEDSKNFWMQGTGDDGTDVYIGGAANLLPGAAARKVYTNNGGSSTLSAPGNHISVANIGAFTDADFGLIGTAGEPTLEDLIDWARGADVKNADNDPATLYRQDMGDTLHSQPAAIVYGELGDGTKDVVLFNATNDGYLHAINADTGEEMWSFVPHELLVNMASLYEDDNVDYKNYGIDGDIVPIVADFDNDGEIDVGTDFVYLVFGMRRGGDNYYMLDVTDKNTPKLKWVRTFPEMSQSWSTPVVARVDINAPAKTNALKAVLILGGGYDTVHDAATHPATPDVEGAGIYMLNLETGEQIWRAGRDGFADLQVTAMTRAIPSRIRVIDLNGDQYADRMYAADLGGQIWRFDIANGNAPGTLVAGGVIAQLGAEGNAPATASDTRRFYTTPDVAMFADKRHDRRYLGVSIGSGYRAHPLDNSAGDRFYSLRDPDVFNSLTQAEYDAYDIIRDGDLTEVAGQYDTIIPAGGDGWKFTLPATQKVLSDSQTFDNNVYFVTFEPTINSNDPCIAGQSVNRLYRVDIVNGDPVIDYGEPEPVDGTEADEKRVTKLEQGGIAPRPQFFFPSPTDPNCTGTECAPAPIGCVGVECFDPGFPNFPVRTLWTQDGIE